MLNMTGETDRRGGDRWVFQGLVALQTFLKETGWILEEKVRYVLVVL